MHFDLEHKNIVDWLDVNDIKFPERLDRRITHVMDLMLKNTLLELEYFLVNLKSSLSNPDHIFNRIQSFYELSFPERPDDETDQFYEDKIEQRAESYKKYCALVKKEISGPKIFNHFINELFSSLTTEIEFVKDQFTKARYGHKIFLARILKNLYAVYLEICQELHQRPSNQYQEIFTAINNEVESLKLIIR